MGLCGNEAYVGTGAFARPGGPGVSGRSYGALYQDRNCSRRKESRGPETFPPPATPICQPDISYRRGNKMPSSIRLALDSRSRASRHDACNAKASPAAAVPAPAQDAPRASTPGKQTAVVSGGCFWGIQAVFQHVKGVISATSGYSGGSAKTAEYEIVSTGETGHAESVQIVYDPSQITYGELLRVFFSVAHDPTQLNRQGPDEGTQYRSSIFYSNDEQKRIAEAYIAQLDRAKVFPRPIVTKVVPAASFLSGRGLSPELRRPHPNQPYIVFNDAPKVEHLRQEFPDLYTGK